MMNPQPGIYILRDPLRLAVCGEVGDGNMGGFEFPLTPEQAEGLAGGILTATDNERRTLAAADAVFLAAASISGIEATQ